jgi:hypothetical protein
MARRSNALLSCPRTRRALQVLAAVMLASGCTQITGGVAMMPPGEDPWLDGMDVDALLLTTPEMRDIVGAGTDLNGIPGMDSKYTVDDELLVETAPPECRFVFRESQVFGPDVKQFHKTSFQYPPKSALLSEAAAAYVDAETARRAFDNVTALVKSCADSPAGYGFVYDWRTDNQTLRAESGDCGRIYRQQATVLIEVTYCGYSRVVPDVVAGRIAAKIGAR